MIASLPFPTWILMAAATLPGLILVVVSTIIHSRAEAQDTGRRRRKDDDG